MVLTALPYVIYRHNLLSAGAGWDHCNDDNGDLRFAELRQAVIRALDIANREYAVKRYEKPVIVTNVNDASTRINVCYLSSPAIVYEYARNENRDCTLRTAEWTLLDWHINRPASIHSQIDANEARTDALRLMHALVCSYAPQSDLVRDGHKAAHIPDHRSSPSIKPPMARD